LSIYREYDIRGIYEKELNEQSVTRIGYALASKIKGEYVAVGYDARSHSPILFEYLVQGLNAGGKKVLDMGKTTSATTTNLTVYLQALLS